jgi:energy-coupling factor transporter ATP-binding protein EcfA2
MGLISLCLDEEYLELGIEKWIPFDFESDGQRVLTIGPSGSGKTIFSKTLIGKLGLRIANIRIWVVDYKGLDFEWLSGCNHYYSVDKAVEGIHAFFTMFENRLYKREPVDSIEVLFVDELSSLLLSLPKKEQEELRGQIARLLNLSRALKIIFISAMQRPSAELFVNGARDNYNIKFMFGANSKETINMVASEYKEFISSCPTGVGYCTINDMNLKKIRSVMPTNTDKLHYVIKEAVNR